MKIFPKALAILKDHGYKVTNPRKNVLTVLLQAKQPLSAYDIQRRLPAAEKIEPVSIYRILDVLESVGLIHKIVSTGGFVSCNAQGEKGCHHFLICDECENVQEIVLKQHEHDPEEDTLIKKLHFTPREHIHEIQGVCHSCAA